jgi:Ca2+-binding EF-hand superfamily protein
LDTDNSGDIDAKELKQAVKDGKLSISDDDINKIVCSIDVNNSDSIDYSEFIYACIGEEFF